MRLIHAVRELNAEGGDHDPDRGALHRRRAHRDVRPRGRPRLPARPGLGAALPRPRGPRRGRCARPAPTPPGSGWGFVAEDPAFAELCDQLGVTFIGPSAEAMRQLGDKIGSKLIAEEVGVPVAPWSRGAVDTLEDALAASKSIGYPLMLKATAGGGGRGIRVVTSDDDLADAYERTRDEAAARVRQRRGLPRAPGHRRPPRRGAGHRRRAGHRLGARRARLLDPAPQPEGHRGVRLAGARPPSRPPSSRSRPSGWRSPSGYRGAGTVEFLYHPQEQLVRLPRGQHPAAGRAPDHRGHHRRRPGQGPAPRRRRRPARGRRRRPRSGHAVEARLNAEDPDRDFAPVAGADRAAATCRPARASGSTPASARATPSPPTSTR